MEYRQFIGYQKLRGVLEAVIAAYGPKKILVMQLLCLKNMV